MRNNILGKEILPNGQQKIFGNSLLTKMKLFLEKILKQKIKWEVKYPK
jgi:hypothetical protein